LRRNQMLRHRIWRHDASSDARNGGFG